MRQGEVFALAVHDVDFLRRVVHVRRHVRMVLNRNYVNSYLWKPALKAASVPQTRENGFHALRHHFASVLLANGVDIRAMATYLGHSDPGFTHCVYTHLMPDTADRMRAAVDRVLSSTSDGPETAQEAVR